MPAWEYEIFIKEINAAIKEENEKNNKKMDETGVSNMHKFTNPKYANNMSKKMMSDIKMPKMPKL